MSLYPLPNVKHKLEAWLITWETVYLIELNDRWSLKNKIVQMDTWVVKFSWFDLSLLYRAVSQIKLYCSHKWDNHSALHVFRFFVWIWKRAVWKLYFWLDLNDNHPSPKKCRCFRWSRGGTPLVYNNRPVKDHLTKFNQVESPSRAPLLFFFLNCEFEQYNPLIGEGGEGFMMIFDLVDLVYSPLSDTPTGTHTGNVSIRG